jgi:selenide,water dikinase
MNIVGMPATKLPPETIRRILQGGADVARAAGCCLVGGHSIRAPEPIYGMSVTGLVHPDRVITNAGASAGDLLVLTKPLGTGSTTTAIKRNLAPPALVNAAIASMCTLNTAGAELGESGLVRAGTDVTGFGLLGHLTNICRGSGVAAEIDAAAVPVLGDAVWSLVDQGCIPGGTQTNLKTADQITDWADTPDRVRVLLCDAQTSGPLLLCVKPERLEQVAAVLQRHHTPCANVIGRVTEPGGALLRIR